MKKTLSRRALIIAMATSAAITAAGAFCISAFSPAPIAAAHFYTDIFFVNITFAGDSFFAFAMIFSLLFFFDKKDLSLRLLFAVIISLTVTQLMKNIFSAQPVHLYFEPGRPENIPVNTIVSSHAALAFTMAVFFALRLNSNAGKALLLLTAILIACSRLYFHADAPAALIAGFLPAIIAITTAQRVSFYGTVKPMHKKRKKERRNAQELIPV